jgi:hypothetical protein
MHDGAPKLIPTSVVDEIMAKVQSTRVVAKAWSSPSLLGSQTLFPCSFCSDRSESSIELVARSHKWRAIRQRVRSRATVRKDGRRSSGGGLLWCECVRIPGDTMCWLAYERDKQTVQDAAVDATPTRPTLHNDLCNIVPMVGCCSIGDTRASRILHLPSYHNLPSFYLY